MYKRCREGVLKKMEIENKTLQKYQRICKEQNIELCLLNRSNTDLKRLTDILLQINSDYLSPYQEGVSFEMYVRKLNDQAYNFVLSHEHKDIGFVSVYANDYINKASYISSMGILSTYQGKKISVLLSEIIIDFTKEKNLKFIKCEVDKNNNKIIGLIEKFGLKKECETDRGTCMMILELKESHIVK